MDIIAITRELGKQLQQEESYIKMRAAQQACDEDEGLQKAIGEFNLKRMAINNEAQKDDREEDALIMENGHMQAYNDSKVEFDALLQRITGIIGLCADGENPETCDYDAASCSGDCSSCGGSCH